MSSLFVPRSLPRLITPLVAAAIAVWLLLAFPVHTHAQDELIASQETPTSTVTVTSTETVSPSADLDKYPWFASSHVLFLSNAANKDFLHTGQTVDEEKRAAFGAYRQARRSNGSMEPIAPSEFQELSTTDTAMPGTIFYSGNVSSVFGTEVSSSAVDGVAHGDLSVMSFPKLPWPYNAQYLDPNQVEAARSIATAYEGHEFCTEAEMVFESYGPSPKMPSLLKTFRSPKSVGAQFYSCWYLVGFITEVKVTPAGNALDAYFVVMHTRADGVKDMIGPMGPHVLLNVVRIKNSNSAKGMYIWDLIRQADEAKLADAMKTALINPLPDFGIAPLGEDAVGQIAGTGAGIGGLYMAWKIVENTLSAPVGMFLIFPTCGPMQVDGLCFVHMDDTWY